MPKLIRECSSAMEEEVDWGFRKGESTSEVKSQVGE